MGFQRGKGLELKRCSGEGIFGVIGEVVNFVFEVGCNFGCHSEWI